MTRLRLAALAAAITAVLFTATASPAFALPEFAKGMGAAITVHGAMKLTGGAKTITCTESSGEGEVVSVHEATLKKITYKGCSGSSCPATIETKALALILGETSEAKDGVGIELKAQAEETIAKLTCGKETVVIEGIVIGEVKPVKTETKAATYLFAEAGGSQAIKSIVTSKSEKGTLHAFGTTAVLATTIEASFTKVVEVSGGIFNPVTEEQDGSENGGAPTKIPCECSAPVNPATGNLSESEIDLAIGGRGPSLEVNRTYNSLLAGEAAEAGPFGFGWSGPYSAHLGIEEAAGTVTVHESNGAAVIFHNSAGKFVAGSWVQATLAKEGTNYIYTLPSQTKLEFNSAGRLTKETDRTGNSLTFAYKAEKSLETVTDGDGRKLTFAYNVGGQVESIKDPLGHTVSYEYETGNLMSVTIEGKVRWKFGYNATHGLTKVTDGLSHSTTAEFDASHRATKRTVAGHERKWTYGTGETTLTEPNGSETLVRFNEAGEPTEVTRAKGVAGVETTTKYEYTSAWRISKLTDGLKHASEYGYDSEGNRTSEKDPAGDERKWAFDKTHDVETETTPEGETTTIKRNAKGEPEVIERPVGAETEKTEYHYNEKGDVTEATDGLKHTSKFSYDAAGDRETETDPEGDERKFKYNEDSQKTEETDPRKLVTKYEVDEQGRPKKITDPLLHTTEYVYNGDGNVESITDGDGHTTKYTYNEEDRRSKIEEPNKATIETGYDSEGQVTSRTDANTHKWEYKRNQLEQVTEEIDPLEHKKKREYDAAGHLKKVEDPEKHTIEYTYDEAGRPKTVKYSTTKPSEVTYEYNKDSKVQKMTDETGTTENTYDKLDRLTEYKSGSGKTVKYEYNFENQPTKITYPNGKAVTRAYDKDGRLESVTDWNSRVDSFGYNADSKLTSVTYPAESKYEDQYVYNEANQITEIKLLKGGELVGSQVYTRDNDGLLKKTTNKGFPGPEISEYKYDEENRLTEAGGLAYEYDKANNPTKFEGKGLYSYNSADELEKGPEATYTYDADGRRTETKPSVGPATTYGYDQVGNVTSVKRSEEGEIKKIEDSYTYDGNNLRQSQTINGTTTHLTWDTAEETPQVLSDENNFYIYGPENLSIEQITSGGATQWMHHDQEGSMRMIMNLKGEIEAAYTFNPFGSLNSTSHASNSLLRYGDQYTSTDSGLVYLRARTYDPSTGQFLSVDPALESTGEPYAYSEDDPLNSGDVTGQATGGVCAQVTITIPLYTGAVMGCVSFGGGGKAASVTLSLSFGINPPGRNLVIGAVEAIAAFKQLSGSLRGLGLWTNANRASQAELEGRSDISLYTVAIATFSATYLETKAANGRIMRAAGGGRTFAFFGGGGRSTGIAMTYAWDF